MFLGNGVRVARRVLVPKIGVRIPVPQPRKIAVCPLGYAAVFLYWNKGENNAQARQRRAGVAKKFSRILFVTESLFPSQDFKISDFA